MYAERTNPAVFTRELSAFLAAARSVLQYALAEAQGKPGGQSWYEQVMQNPLLSFFKNLRDNNVHVVPVEPVTKTTMEVAGMLNIGDDDDEHWIPHKHMRMIWRYEFQERPYEDVLDLSLHYLKTLEDIVNDGTSRALISG